MWRLVVDWMRQQGWRREGSLSEVASCQVAPPLEQRSGDASKLSSYFLFIDLSLITRVTWFAPFECEQKKFDNMNSTIKRICNRKMLVIAIATP